MNIEEILDMLDELLDKAWNLPLTGGRCVVDAEKVRDMIDDIRLNMPAEIKQAKAIGSDRAEILSAAKTEAESIVRKAEERSRSLLAQEEIVRQAQAKANEILSQAREQAQSRLDEADAEIARRREEFTRQCEELVRGHEALRRMMEH